MFDRDINVTENFGLNVLLALLPQTVHDLAAVRLAFQFLEKIYVGAADIRPYLIENGLLPSATKALTRFYGKWGTTNEKVADCMQVLFYTVALKSLCSTGSINVINV